MKSIKKLIACVLAAAMVFALAVPVGAVGDDETAVAFEKVDNDLVSAKLNAAEKYEEVEKPALYSDTDIVRVSIILD